MDEISLNTFPARRAEALALLYVQSRDLSEKTPEDITRMYLDAYTRVNEEMRKVRNELKGFYADQKE